jgi:nicotinamide mononucleotide transporter
MVVNKILETWLYWIVIDAASIYLYINKELYFTALLFGLYVIIATYGYFHWKKLYQNNTHETLASNN